MKPQAFVPVLSIGILFCLPFSNTQAQTISQSQEKTVDPKENSCKKTNPVSPLFSNLDTPANINPDPTKHFTISGSVKHLSNTTTSIATFVWKPDLCTPLNMGIQQKFTIENNSQQTLIGVSWKNISVTGIQENGELGVMVSGGVSF